MSIWYAGSADAVRLCVPQPNELWFRQSLLADEETMAYNHRWGGAIPFPRESWAGWYGAWLCGDERKRFYRYLRLSDTGEFVGEVAYHIDEERGIALASVIVAAPFRGRGYGRKGLELLMEAAREHGITELYDDIAIDNPAIVMFLDAGFHEEYRTDEIIMLKKEL